MTGESFMRYKLDASNIDAVSKEVNAYLAQRNTEDKDRVHTKLSVEEVLLDYMGTFGSDAEFTLEYDGGLSRSRIRLMVPGEPLDPFALTETNSEDGLYLASVLSAMGQRPKWKYIRGVNTITYTPAKKSKLSQIVTILIGLLCGTVAGLLIQALVPNLAGDILSRVITPLTDAFVGLLCVMATVLCFAAVALGIVRLGDISTFSTVGKKLIRSFLAVAFLLTLACTASMMPGIRFGHTAQMSLNFFDFFDILIGFVPNNILKPILEFNSVQIIIIGIMFGMAMLKMGQKAENLCEIIDEVNLVAILSNSYLTRFISAYLALMVCGQILSGSLATVSIFIKLIIIVVIADVLTLAAYTAVTCIRLRVSVRIYVNKLLPSFLIGLSSANVGAAFMPAIDALIGPLGVDGDYAPLAYNLGSVLFRPGHCIVFIACSLFTAGMYGAEVTWSWVAAAFLLSFILSVATPPVIGGTTVCFSILFSQLGLKSEALAMIISLNAFFEFLTVAVNNYSLQSHIVLLGHSIGKLDTDRLRR
jgi:Na+/H+-dicarboxylate symporter